MLNEPLLPDDPGDWRDQITRAYRVFTFKPPPKQEIKNVLRARSGQFMRRRNSPESMANAPSPYKKPIFYPAPLHNLIRLDRKGLPRDVYDQLQKFLDRRVGAERWNRETRKVITDARNRPDLPVTMFRPVPQIINQFTPNDVIVLSPNYAQAIAASRPRWRVITGTVPAKELFTTSDDQLMRWKWRGDKPLPNGGIVPYRPTRGRRSKG